VATIETEGLTKLYGAERGIEDVIRRRDSVAIRARLGNLPGDFGFGKRTSGLEALSLLARLRGIDGLGRRADLDDSFAEARTFYLSFAAVVAVAASVLAVGVLAVL
jgi:hypothetical protein